MASHDPLPILIACAGIVFTVGLLALRKKRRIAAFASTPLKTLATNPSEAINSVARIVAPNPTRPPPPHPRPSPAVTNAPDLPEPTAFAPTPAAVRNNQIWRFFEEYGFEWLTPREQIEARTPQLLLPPWNDKMVSLRQNHPALQNMIRPVCFGAEAQPARLPPVEFHGILSPVTDDPKANFDRLVAILEEDLGPHQTTPSVNVYSAVWKAGPAEIRVMVWPRHLNAMQYRPDAWRGDPATREAVHIYFKTGLVFHLQEAEAIALCAARPLELRYPGITAKPQRHLGADLSLMRELPAGRAAEFHALRGKLLLNDAAQYLFAVGEECAWVVPMKIAMELRLIRVTPAKGPGYSELRLSLTHWAPKRVRGLSLASGNGPDDLTVLAENLGSQLGLPVMIEPYQPDM